MSGDKARNNPNPRSQFEIDLDDVLSRVKGVMMDRHAKYGAGNISRHGMTGIVVRLGDKYERLEQGLEDHDDETLLSTLDDVVGYGLIGIMWELSMWPGSEKPLADWERDLLNAGHGAECCDREPPEITYEQYEYYADLMFQEPGT